LGDDIQLMKMGILEIADVFLVNKADRPGARELKEQIELALHESPGETSRTRRMLGPQLSAQLKLPVWAPPVLLVSALDRTGGDEVIQALTRHRTYLDEPALSAALRRNRLAREIVWRATRRFGEELAAKMLPGGALSNLVDDCAEGRAKLPDAIDRLLGNHP
jgi:LAO/AO transport system kinase